ncbi:ABC transporter ATP-binding protein [Pseudobacillus badius]|uniref:ABC transporter ATP-binding protein n=1 Tax=Bacillus badius TaxID=1455 RepID=UPI0007B079E3|nr:ABC transporter ATP-binding protein [Bacillus badius]KZO00778.1 ABC transporter ATP-binding protein [Bacillus badius]OCS88187.1 ABC transporter ATP-binding protein [Bacillus badius]OVE53285.1 ABC transporter ATP-binding protein [Bacillus badius]TDW05621.1 putative ABC transport system ATP-binding protein [Bacillus badius]
MKKIIIGDRITKSFGEREEQRNVLDELSIEINEGEFVAIMGPSGSGKSTLMFALSGMDEVNSGKVVFGDRDLSAMGENELSDMRRTKMGFVFQQPIMLKNLNIIDNIILPMMRDNRKNVASISDKARALMKRVGIGELEEHDITQVSGGQLQRAGICRALINNPKIIFGDEPTGALNSKSAQEIMNIFSEINEEGTTVLLVTHDAKVAARTERVMFMRDGKIVSELKLSKYDGTNMDTRIEKVTRKMIELGI